MNALFWSRCMTWQEARQFIAHPGQLRGGQPIVERLPVRDAETQPAAPIRTPAHAVSGTRSVADTNHCLFLRVSEMWLGAASPPKRCRSHARIDTAASPLPMRGSQPIRAEAARYHFDARMGRTMGLALRIARRLASPLLCSVNLLM